MVIAAVSLTNQLHLLATPSNVASVIAEVVVGSPTETRKVAPMQHQFRCRPAAPCAMPSTAVSVIAEIFVGSPTETWKVAPMQHQFRCRPALVELLSLLPLSTRIMLMSISTKTRIDFYYHTSLYEFRI